MPGKRTWVSLLRSIFERVKMLLSKTSPVKFILYQAHKTEFAQCRPLNGYSGVYLTFEDAQKAIPAYQKSGYDHIEMSQISESNLGEINFREFPVLYWLRSVSPEVTSVLDLGGHCGELFYAFDKYLNFSADFSWCVFDVPSVVESGRQIAIKKNASLLSFTTNTDSAEKADLLLVSGSLQYFHPDFFPALLEKVKQKTKHIIIHHTPIHPEKTFITIQAAYKVFCPYVVTSRSVLINLFAEKGYELVDTWKIPRVLDVPFFPECHIDFYSGLYFRLKN
jgi:putative methyltransferase (TIGR04325 family)